MALSLDVDHGARDARIRLQTYSPVRRLDGLPEALFANYWRDVHGPLCSRLPGLGFYVQHHFSRTQYANLWPLPPGVKPMSSILDGMVEIGFANSEDAASFGDASSILFGDELNLFSHDLAYSLPHGSKTLVDRQADGAPNGPDALHRLHLHLDGSPDEAFRAWASGFAETLAADPAVLKVRLHLPQSYRNDAPAPPSPGVDHHASEDCQNLAMIEIGFASGLAARTFFETDAYKATVPGLTENVRSLGVFLVTGVYTFVRDGVMTTAGLRGSRAAEIIATVGATNHMRPEVVGFFTPHAPGDGRSHYSTARGPNL
jgi:hypothetical protein